MGEPLRSHWLPPALLEVSVTLPPAQKVVGPPGVMVGVAGMGLRTTLVIPAAEVQPLTVTVTEYVPASAVVAFARVGFCSDEVKPFGPVQAYVALGTVAVKSAMVLPAQYGPPFVGAGVAGVPMVTFAELIAV